MIDIAAGNARTASHEFPRKGGSMPHQCTVYFWVKVEKRRQDDPVGTPGSDGIVEISQPIKPFWGTVVWKLPNHDQAAAASANQDKDKVHVAISAIGYVPNDPNYVVVVQSLHDRRYDEAEARAWIRNTQPGRDFAAGALILYLAKVDEVFTGTKPLPGELLHC
jgi:hypothetical protein